MLGTQTTWDGTRLGSMNVLYRTSQLQELTQPPLIFVRWSDLMISKKQMLNLFIDWGGRELMGAVMLFDVGGHETCSNLAVAPRCK